MRPCTTLPWSALGPPPEDTKTGSTRTVLRSHSCWKTGVVLTKHLDDPISTAKKDALRNMRSTIQLKLRQMKDSWLSNKADEIQGYADRNDMKKFFDGLEEIYGPTTSGSPPLLSADGSSLITDKDKILERWAQHFDSVLKRPSTINNEAINRLQQVNESCHVNL